MCNHKEVKVCPRCAKTYPVYYLACPHCAAGAGVQKEFEIEESSD